MNIYVILLLSVTFALTLGKKHFVSRELLSQRAAKDYCETVDYRLAKINRHTIRQIRGRLPMLWVHGLDIRTEHIPRSLSFLYRDGALCCRVSRGRKLCERSICNRIAPALCSK